MATFDEIKKASEIIQQYASIEDVAKNANKSLIEANRELQKLYNSEMQSKENILEQIRLRNELDQNSIKLVKSALEESKKKLEILVDSRQAKWEELKALEKEYELLVMTSTLTKEKEREIIFRQKQLSTQLRNSVAQHKIEKDSLENQVKSLKDKVNFTQRYEHYLQLTNKAESKLAQKGRKMAADWFKIRDVSNSFWHNIKNIDGTFNKIKFSTTSLVKGFNSMATGLGLFATALNTVLVQTKALIFEFEKQAALTAALTGRNRQYNTELMDAAVMSREFAVSLSESSESFRSLYSNMAIFSQSSAQVRQELTLLASKMAIMGISTADSAQTLDNLTKSLGLTARGAQRATIEIFNLAKDIGLDTRRIQADFRATFSELSVYGTRSVEIFKNLAAASKVTGISIQRLQQTFGRAMDTFEGSADVAGKLNTILGRDLVNSVDLLYASEDERIRIIKQSLDATGRQFSQMSKFEKLAIANAAGIKDMNEANRIFGMSLVAYDEMQLKAKMAQSDQKKFNEAVKASATFMKKLEIAWQNFAIAVQPIVEVLGKIVGLISDFFAWFNKTAAMMGGWRGEFTKLAPVILLLAAPLAFVSAKVALITVAIGGLISAVSALWKWWHKSGSPQFWQMPTAMAEGMIKYKSSIEQTNPKLLEHTNKTRTLHEVQTKKKSPAMWEMGKVMSDGMQQYNNSLKQIGPSLTETTNKSSFVAEKMSHVSNRFANATSQSVTNNVDSSANTTNSSSINNVTNKLDQLITTINQSRGSGRPVKIDVNFLDIEKTKKQFQDAVIQALEEVYG